MQLSVNLHVNLTLEFWLLELPICQQQCFCNERRLDPFLHGHGVISCRVILHCLLSQNLSQPITQASTGYKVRPN